MSDAEDQVDVVLVSSLDGDWIGMYVDGELVEEGHSIRPHRAIEALVGKHVGRLTEREEDLSVAGTLPPKLDDMDEWLKP